MCKINITEPLISELVNMDKDISLALERLVNTEGICVFGKIVSYEVIAPVLNTIRTKIHSIITVAEETGTHKPSTLTMLKMIPTMTTTNKRVESIMSQIREEASLEEEGDFDWDNVFHA